MSNHMFFGNKYADYHKEREQKMFLGSIFREIRKRVGFTLGDMKVLAGDVSITTISNFERGYMGSNMRKSTLSRICWAYDISTDFVLGKTDVPLNCTHTKINQDAQSIIRQRQARIDARS